MTHPPSPTGDGASLHDHAAVPLYGEEFRRSRIAVYRRLVAMGPVAPVLLEPDVPAWMAVDYQTIVAICRNPLTYPRDSRQWHDYAAGRVSHSSELLQMMTWRPNVLFADGEEHARLRRAITDSVGRIVAGALDHEVRMISHRLIDIFAARGHADLIKGFADVLPLLVCNRLFGLSDESGYRLLDILARIWNGADAERAGAELHRLLGDLIAEKHHRPGPDLTTSLLQHRAGLSDEELLEHLVLIIGATATPTSALIGNALNILLTDEQIGRDVGGHRLSVEAAIHRALWFRAPFSAYPFVYPSRTVDFPAESGKVTVPAGSPIALGLGAANLALAERAGMRTDNRAHLAFGVGPHECPAKDPAVRVAAVAIETLLMRLAGLRLAVPAAELTVEDSVFRDALTELPVSFNPRASIHVYPGGSTWPSSGMPLIRPVTSTARPPSSAPAARSRPWSFLARLGRGR